MWIKTVDLADGPAEEKLHAGAFAELAAIAPANDDERFARAAALVQLGRYEEARPDLVKLTTDARLGAAAALELALCEMRKIGGDDAVLALLEPVIADGGSEIAARPRAADTRRPRGSPRGTAGRRGRGTARTAPRAAAAAARGRG